MAKTWDVIVQSTEEDFNRIATIDNAVSFSKESEFAIQIISNSSFLQKCTTESLRNAVINVAAVGLTLNPAMKLAYLVPRDGRACLDISYIGLVKLATDTGSVAAVKAEIVRANDMFEYNGPMQKPTHKFNPFAPKDDRGEIVGVYVLARLANGVDLVETLDMEEIAKIRAKSKASNGPWKDWFEEMCKKAAIKRASKAWPRTERLSAAEAILNEHEGNAEPIGGRGAEVARAVQEEERASAQQSGMDKLKTYLEAEAKKGVEAYKRAWNDLTKEQRIALKAEHTDWKKAAIKADAQDISFNDMPGGDYVPE